MVRGWPTQAELASGRQTERAWLNGNSPLAPPGIYQLPPGVMEHAVWRTVGGCPVREIVFGGQTYYLSSASPHLERLDPASAIQRR